MKKNPLKDGVISENSAGVGTVTRETVQARLAELAIIDGDLSDDANRCPILRSQVGIDRRVGCGSERCDSRILLPSPNAGIRCPAGLAAKCEWLRVKMKTKKVAATVNGSSKAASLKPRSSKASKPPKLPQKRIYESTGGDQSHSRFRSHQFSDASDSRDVLAASLYVLIAATAIFKGLNPQQLQLLADSALEMKPPGRRSLRKSVRPSRGRMHGPFQGGENRQDGSRAELDRLAQNEKAFSGENYFTLGRSLSPARTPPRPCCSPPFAPDVRMSCPCRGIPDDGFHAAARRLRG